MFSMTSASVDAARGRRALERIEVHAHEVDRLDVVLLERLGVLGRVAHREQARVELGVQRLDAAVHDLGEARVVVDRADLEAGVGQLAGGAARRHELDPELGQPAGEVHDARLVGHGEERAADLHGSGGLLMRHLRMRHAPEDRSCACRDALRGY